MKVKEPCGFNVLVKLKKVEKTSAGGIVLPENHVSRQQKAAEEATVIALGPTAYKGFDNGTPWCQPGDLVAIKMYSGMDYTYENGDVYRIIRDDDVMAVLEEDKE